MDWAYIAGYFDGEGCVHNTPTKRGTKTTCLAWYNTHVESLQAICDFMEVGSVRARPEGSSGFGGKKPAYELKITNKAGLLHALDNMLPHLIVKRKKAEALKCYLIEHVDETRMISFGAVARTSTEQLRAWYMAGESYAQIGARLGVHHSAVLQAFKLRGLKARPAGGAHSKGVPKSEETKRRMRASRRRMWEDPAFRASQLRNLSRGMEA
jgi:hypothetical protein